MQANNIDDIQWFDVEYDIHFTSEIGCLICSQVRSTIENIKKIQLHE